MGGGTQEGGTPQVLQRGPVLAGVPTQHEREGHTAKPKRNIISATISPSSSEYGGTDTRRSSY